MNDEPYRTVGTRVPGVEPEPEPELDDERPGHPGLWTPAERADMHAWWRSQGLDPDARERELAEAMGPVEDYVPAMGERGFEPDV